MWGRAVGRGFYRSRGDKHAAGGARASELAEAQEGGELRSKKTEYGTVRIEKLNNIALRHELLK